jgi:hypothetical protein
MAHYSNWELSMATLSPERLYDFFIVGLSYLNRETPRAPRRGSSIIHAMHITGGVTVAQWRSLDRNTGLISFAMGNAEMVRANRRPPKNVTDRVATSSPKHLITLVIPGSQLIYPRMFGPSGYEHIITDAGLAYADTKRANTVPYGDFMTAWAVHVRQMSAMNARGSEPRE